MIALIKIHLIKKTRSGRSVLQEKFIFKKDELDKYVEKINQFIFEWIYSRSKIRATEFHVQIMTQNKHNIVKQWKYKPTYRD